MFRMKRWSSIGDLSVLASASQYAWKVDDTPKTVAIPRSNGIEMRLRIVIDPLSAYPHARVKEPDGWLGLDETFVPCLPPLITGKMIPVPECLRRPRLAATMRHCACCVGVVRHA